MQTVNRVLRAREQSQAELQLEDEEEEEEEDEDDKGEDEDDDDDDEEEMTDSKENSIQYIMMTLVILHRHPKSLLRHHHPLVRMTGMRSLKSSCPIGMLMRRNRRPHWKHPPRNLHQSRGGHVTKSEIQLLLRLFSQPVLHSRWKTVQPLLPLRITWPVCLERPPLHRVPIWEAM